MKNLKIYKISEIIENSKEIWGKFSALNEIEAVELLRKDIEKYPHYYNGNPDYDNLIVEEC